MQPCRAGSGQIAIMADRTSLSGTSFRVGSQGGSFERVSAIGKSPKGTSSTRGSDAYLSELLSYSLDRLRKEPDLLHEEKQTIEKNIQSTSVQNYPAFIETSRCLDTINSELGAVCERLDMLLQVLHGVSPCGGGAGVKRFES